MNLLVQTKLVEQLQSIAVFVWQETMEDVDYFRSNPLLLQRKQSSRNNAFALRTNGRNKNLFVRTEKFLFPPVPMNFTRWQKVGTDL